MSNLAKQPQDNKNTPSRAEAEAAVKTLLDYIGEDTNRVGLLETPARVIRSFDEFYAGYKLDARDELQKTFEDITGFDDMVLVKSIDFVSHCEHHMVPITGKAHVAYWPGEKVVGISKLARVVEIYAKRLVSQENMTRGIGDAITDALTPKGVAVMIDANHQCMSTRGVNKPSSSTVTMHFTGVFRDSADLQRRFMDMIKA